MPKQGMQVLMEQTEQFIDQNPSMVTLTRYTQVDDGAGGSSATSVVLEPQKARVISQRSAVPVERRTASGVVVTPEIVLQMMPWSDVQRGDTFLYLGVLMEVVWVHDVAYEKLAEVTTQ